MKNRFGFIPIVLPAIVMVLIIGLINLAGPQAAQAQEDTSNADARLTGLTMTYVDGGVSGDLPIFQSNGTEGFTPRVGRYTATVDNAVESVTVAAVAPDGYTAAAPVVTGANTDLTLTNAGKTTLRINVAPTADATDIQAVYIIEVTKSGPNIGLQGARLGATGLTLDPTAPFMRADGVAIAFDPGINEYYARLPFTVASVLVSATKGANTYGDTVNAVKIRGDDRDIIEGSAAETSTVAFNPGQMKTVYVDVYGPGTDSTYKLHITRSNPEPATLQVTSQLTGASDGDQLNLAADADEYHNDVITAEVPYEVDRVTVAVTAPATTVVHTSTARIVSPQDAVADTTTDAASTGHQVNLRPGAVTTVSVETKQFLAADNRTTTRTYSLQIERAAPVLDDVTLAVDTRQTSGIFVQEGNGSATDGDNLIPADVNDPDTTADETADNMAGMTKYTVMADFDVDRVTVFAMRGEQPVGTPSRDPVIVTISPPDADSGVIGHQVDLNAPGVKKTIKITARSTRHAGVKTEYMIDVTRMKTVLVGGTTAGSRGIEISCDDTGACPTGMMLVPAGTTTANTFASTTMSYMGSVPYTVDSVSVMTNLDATNDAGKKVAFSQPIATTTNPLPVSLDVGNNDVAVDVGVMSASLAPNTTTYSIAIERRAPEVTLQITLVDKDGNPLGDGPQPFMLDAQSRSYDFEASDETTFTANDVLLLNALRVSVSDMPEDGVRVSSNRVTVPGPDGTEYLTLSDLSSGDVTVQFEVRYEVGDGTEDASTHIVHVRRPDNSQPTFPANHPLRDRQIVMLADSGFSPNGQNAPVELPYASSGNGDLEYVLKGDETKGPVAIPEDLDYVKPSGTTNGRLTGIPTLLPQSDGATHYLLFEVTDGDGITTDDSDVIEFSIRIVRDPSLITPSDIDAPDAGELFDIDVRYDLNEDADDGAEKSAKPLSPKFDPNLREFTATVPTDIDEVDIHVLASSSASVTLQGRGTSQKTTGVGSIYGTGTRHEWGGHQLKLGSVVDVNNPYTIIATDDGSTVTYTLNVVREGNTPPAFESNNKITFKYYEGIEVGTSAANALPKQKLPVAMGGNGASSTWMYTMERRAATAPVDDNDYLGLMIQNNDMPSNPGKNPPYLSGTPKLDTNNPADTRLADNSEVYAKYTVQDNDKDTRASDTDSLDVDIFVYRDVTLLSYSVDGNTVSNLDEATRKYRDSRTYSHADADIKYYTYSVAHDATVATFAAVERHSSADAVVTPADADSATAGHQVNLSPGTNEVTVTVTNGAMTGTHVINLRRPGLQASMITLTEDEDTRSNTILNKSVKLDPDPFDREVREYTAMVETWVRSVQVAATPVDPNARVWVNDFEIQDPPGYTVVDLPNMGDTTNDITVGVSVGNGLPSADEGYTIMVTRKADTAPEFDGGMDDITRTVDRTLVYPIELPKAVKDSGNGAPMYSVNTEELPPGLRFDTSSHAIVGTPTLDEGYSSDFEVTFTVADEDGNTAASDMDTVTFTITITHDIVSEIDTEAPTVDPSDRNKLSNLIVTYDQAGVTNKFAVLSPAFSPSSGGPYEARVPHDATNVQVTTVPADTEAVIAINNTRIAGGVKLNLPPQATIVVSHADLADDMTYTLNTVRTTDSVPDFGDSTVDDMTYASGEDIDPMTLPMATGGDGAVSYSLRDHEGRIPDGLEFSASTRTLSGRPVLLRDAVATNYRMTYTATDENGDSASLSFMITVCDDSDGGCMPTMPEPNPGYTPVGLEVSISGNTATLTWQPGDDAMRQFVGAVDPTADDIFSTIRPAPFGDDQVAADEDMYVIEDLMNGGAGYVFVVAGYDGSMWHVAIWPSASQ